MKLYQIGRIENHFEFYLEFSSSSLEDGIHTGEDGIHTVEDGIHTVLEYET